MAPMAARASLRFAELLPEGDRSTRAQELLRTISAATVDAAGSSLWAFPEPPPEGAPAEAAEEPVDTKASKKGAAKKAAEPPPDAHEPGADALEPECTPDAAGQALLVSHAWGQPWNWETYFGEKLFHEVKDLCARAGLAAAILRGLAGAAAAGSPDAVRVWLDRASLPAPVATDDHPSESLDFGPYALPVRELKAFAARGETIGRYTATTLKEPYSFKGTMEVHERDGKGRIMQDGEVVEVQWSVPPGRYYARRCRVIAEGRITREDAETMEALDLSSSAPAEGGLRKWPPRLRLRDEVWTELTLGSMRAECLELAEENLALHSGLVVVAGWNYFDRLWPLCEWALFCAARGPERVQLATLGMPGPVVVEYQRALRRLGVAAAECRDWRDRPLLLAKLEAAFPGCRPYEEKTYGCAKWTKPAGGRPKELLVRSGLQSGPLPEIHHERLVDWKPLERYVRATAIGVFAREAALNASEDGRERSEWGGLAEELGLFDLRDALKDCRPWLWHRQLAVEHEAAQEEGQREASYRAVVEDWWCAVVLPVLQEELARARGGAA